MWSSTSSFSIDKKRGKSAALLSLGYIMGRRCTRVILSLPAAAQGPVESDDGQEFVGPVLG